MPRKPAASYLSTPACMSQVAAVCRSVCGVTAIGRLARATADLKAVLTECTGSPDHSRKKSLMIPFAT